MSSNDHECEQCGRPVDSEGYIEHSRGCMVVSPDGGGRQFIGKPVMTWTTEKPTQPGWYGYRDEHTKDENTKKVRGLIFEVRESLRNDGRLLLFTHLNLYGETEDCHHVDKLDGEWFGPLEIPE